MLRLEGVSKSFGNTPALRTCDLEVEVGKTAVVIGPSGCGKSTVLRLINGLISPDTGRVLVDDVELRASNLLEMRRRMGYVIQEGGLFPHLTARRNIFLMADYLGVDESRKVERLAELTEITKLSEELLDRYPLQLSGGQRQRVSLMRALMLEPELLLLDEPLGALDPIIRADLQEDLKEIFSSLRTTTVLVTHDVGEAAYLGDSIVLMKDGRMIQKGTIEDLLSRPASPFVERFLRAQRFSPSAAPPKRPSDAN